MGLFETYPLLKDDAITVKQMTAADARALNDFTHSERVYEFLPTFLYEQKYEDAAEMLKKLHAECFETLESLLLGVYLNDASDELVGIAEVYNYEPDRQKASIGYRLAEHVWGRGIATRVTRLLKDYLIGRAGIRVITAHVMIENEASAAVLRKNGFMVQDVDYHVLEDWGFEAPVVVDKYVFIAYGD